jgi:uncharacterized protein with beta-barrel porin domain
LSVVRSLFVISVVLLTAAGTVRADDLTDTQTGVTGTADADVINVTRIWDVNSILSTAGTQNVSTRTTGVDALAGADQVTVSASLTSRTSSTLDAPFVAVRLGGTSTDATSTGVRGGDGVDAISNFSTVSSTASAYTKIMEATLYFEMGVTHSPTTSAATAVGFEGGSQADVLTNSGMLYVTATAKTAVGKARATTAEIPLESTSVDNGAATATATAIGILGDLLTSGTSPAPGSTEAITNTQQLSVHADATTTTGQGVAEVIGSVRLDDSTRAKAIATGIQGGASATLITNQQTVDVNAVSYAHLSSFEGKIKGLFIKSVLDVLGYDVGQYVTEANSVAVGLAGNQAGDTIVNQGTPGMSGVNVHAKATADSTIHTFSLSPPLFGSSAAPAAALDVMTATSEETTDPGTSALQDAGTRAISSAWGILGADGNDTVTNATYLTSKGESYATGKNIGIDLTISGSSYLPLPSSAVADTSATAVATAGGVDGGAGDDILNNPSRITTTAIATTQSLGVSATANLGSKGWSVAAAVLDAASTAIANSAGMVGGAGHDTITNQGRVTSTATATDNSTSVAASLPIEGQGIAVGVSLASTETNAVANSFGIIAGDGSGMETESDTVVNKGILATTATSTSHALSVDVSVAAALEGAAVAVAVADSQVEAHSRATGILTGGGADVVDNNTPTSMTTTATATSTNDSVTVSASGSLKGVAAGASYADANTVATANATGISVGDSNDRATSHGQMTTSAAATATSTSVTVNVSVAALAGGEAVSHSGIHSEAASQAMSGGSGDDSLTNTALSETSASATSRSHAVTVNYAMAGAALADVTSNADAWATGLAGGEGADTLNNTGTLQVSATSKTDNTAGTATFFGEASGDLCTRSTAIAIGLDGGPVAAGQTRGETLTNGAGGYIGATSTANADANSYVVNVGGAGFAKLGPTTDSRALSMVSGDMNDTLTNQGTLVAIANSQVAANNASYGLLDVLVGSVGVNGTARATGMDAGSGENTLTNAAGAYVNTYADLSTTSLNLQASIGGQVTVAGVTADAFSTGLRTGDDHDEVYNYGSISSTACSLGQAGGASIGLISMSLVHALATADIRGIDSGGGDDHVENQGTITAGSILQGDSYLVKADTTAVAYDMVSFVSSSLGAAGTATGIEAGTGNDTVLNSGTIRIGDTGSADSCTGSKAQVLGRSYGFGGQFAGMTIAFAGSSARMTSVGIDGGSGDDWLDNSGTLDIRARSYNDVDAETHIWFGIAVAGVEADSIGVADATGLSAGTGRDTVSNRGAITADAWTIADAATNAQVDAFADPHAESYANATATAIGVSGGSGASKTIINDSNGLISSTSNAGSRPYAFSDAGTTRTYGVARAIALSTAQGILSQGTGDTVTNNGSLSALAKAGAYDSSSNIATIDSDEEAALNATITARAFGISLGDGNDAVTNAGAISASTQATGSVYAKTYTRTRYPISTASSTVAGQATGIMAGQGSNDVNNVGRVTVEALADASPQVYSYSRDYTAQASTTGVSNATAYGIKADGTITNGSQGTVDVTARATTFANAPTETEDARATGKPSATATGLAPYSLTGLTALQQITNNGTLTVRALSGEDASGKSSQIAWVSTGLETRSCTATTTGESSADAAGIRSGDGPKEIANTGALTVLARARADMGNAQGAHTYADSTDVTATANGSVTATATAAGILATGGDNKVVNTGALAVTAENKDVFTWVESRSSWRACSATADALGRTTATGILLAGGDDEVHQLGTLTVNSYAGSRAHAFAKTRDDNIASEYETSRAAAEANAVGIQSGGGHDVLDNQGTVTIRSQALSNATYGGADDGITASTRSTASALGVRLGDGGSTIVNSGTIDVSAQATYLGSSPTQLVASAVGIAGGTGDDTIRNDGTITTTTLKGWDALVHDLFNPLVPEAGTAIDAGSGNDTVILSDGSTVKGSVVLGPGDDTLVLRGTPVVNEGWIVANDGSDTLVMDGNGVFNQHLSGFTTVIKQGEGTYRLSGLAGGPALEISRGTLELGHTYGFAADRPAAITAYPDGSHGQLLVSGTANLAGTLVVQRAPGLYRQGTTYDLIKADMFRGEFSEVVLPNAPLLGFCTQQTPTEFDVSVAPRPFASAATNPVELRIGEYMDSSAATATGSLENILATFQGLPQAQFSTAFAGLNPGQYDGSTNATYGTSQQHTQTLVKRIHSIRKWDDLQMDDPCACGFWVDGFGQVGDHRTAEGFTGYGYRVYGTTVGMDHTMDGRFLVGAGLGLAHTSIDFDQDRGDAGVQTVAGSLYASSFTEQGYVDVALGYGYQDYANNRRITFGSTQSAAHSDHSGHLLSAYLETGTNLDIRSWILQPFGSLTYATLRESGFAESGAGDLDQIVHKRTTASLVSELGLRVMRVVPLKKCILVPEASLGWNYDFDIDDRAITASLEGSPGTAFSVEGQHAGRSGAAVGTAVNFFANRGFSGSLRYSGEFRQLEQAHSLLAELRVEF